MVCMADTETVKKFMRQLREAGLDCQEDYAGGLVRATDNDVVVYTAIQKGPGGHWIVRTADSDRVRWG